MIADWPGLLLKVAEIAWINLLLSGDNAIVIALACRGLPEDKRKWGIWAGAGAAIALRIVFTLLVVQLRELPYVKLAGGVLLFWIAVKLVVDDDAHANVATHATVWKAVQTIAVADAVMSLDNVLAIAAVAKGEWGLIILGLLMSVPLIIFGSNLVLALMNRFPAFVWVGCGLLGYVAAEILASDPLVMGWLAGVPEGAVHAIGFIGAALAVASAWLFSRAKGAPAH